MSAVSQAQERKTEQTNAEQKQNETDKSKKQKQNHIIVKKIHFDQLPKQLLEQFLKLTKEKQNRKLQEIKIKLLLPIQKT